MDDQGLVAGLRLVLFEQDRIVHNLPFRRDGTLEQFVQIAVSVYRRDPLAFLADIVAFLCFIERYLAVEERNLPRVRSFAVVDAEMAVLEKTQSFQQKVFHFGGSPALLFFQLSQQFCLMLSKRLVPAEIIVRAVQGAERTKQILHILRGLGGGHFGVRVEFKFRQVTGKIVQRFLIRRWACHILACVQLRLIHCLMRSVDLRQQLVQGGLGRQGRRAAGQRQTGRQGQSTASYKSFHVCIPPFCWRRCGTGTVSV